MRRLLQSLEDPPTENTPHSVANPTANPVVNPVLPVGLPSGDTAHPSPFFPRDLAASLYWCDHAGVLIFAAALAGVSHLGATEQTILAQLVQEAATDTPAAKALRRQLAAAKAADHRYETTRLTRRKDIEVSAQQIVIHLMPRTNYGGELKKAVIQTLDGLNALGLDHPRLPGRKLKFRLGQRSEMELKMNLLP